MHCWFVDTFPNDKFPPSIRHDRYEQITTIAILTLPTNDLLLIGTRLMMIWREPSFLDSHSLKYGGKKADKKNPKTRRVTRLLHWRTLSHKIWPQILLCYIFKEVASCLESSISLKLAFHHSPVPMKAQTTTKFTSWTWKCDGEVTSGFQATKPILPSSPTSFPSTSRTLQQQTVRKSVKRTMAATELDISHKLIPHFQTCISSRKTQYFSKYLPFM